MNLRNIKRSLSKLLPIVFCLLVNTTTADDGVVSRTPPEIYTKHLAPLLTSFEDAIAQENLYEDDESGVIILSERVNYITDAGLRYSASHYIYKANTEAGVDSLTEEIYSYRKSNQRIHLVTARTIQPDGKIQEVRDNAAVLQSPQNDAEDAIYNDRGELLLIYPNVKAGSITESIVVREETSSRVEGELMFAINWATIWPRIYKHQVVNMPASFAAKYKLTDIGSGCPTPTKESIGENRVQYVWESRNVPRAPYEYRKAPTSQTGPYTRTTTWTDWNDLAKWYDTLLANDIVLSDKLQSVVEACTEDLKSDQEIIEALHEMVASEVRYTGLEFGISGFQPYPPSEVWARGYGDCKDKANLLRRCLAQKGITSYLCLLNTEHTGRVEKRSPDTGQFDHAILAIVNPENPDQFIFSDPTISKSRPGLISPNDGDREVLVLNGAEATWARTPPQSAGSLTYDFDLSLSITGEVSGWLEFEAADYYACSYLRSYEQKSDKDRLRSMQDLVEDFYPNAEVIDTEISQMTTSAEPFRIRAYFLMPGAQQTSEQTTTLELPSLTTIVPYLGDNATRRTPRFLWRDAIKVNLAINYPDTWDLTQLPDAYSVSSPGFNAKGQWTHQDNTCSSSITLDSTQSSIHSEDFAATFNAIKSLNAWTELSVHLQKSNGQSDATTAQAASSAPIDLPIMPTAEGQMTLVDSKYPGSGNLDLRRQALEKLLVYFPDDNKSNFNTRTALAYVDYQQDLNEKAAQDILTLIEELADAADTQELYWAKYVRALSLQDAGLKDQATELYLEIYLNTQVSDYRRSWSAYKASYLISKSDPARAIELIRETPSLDSNAQSYLYVLLIELLLEADDLSGAVAELEAVKTQNHPYLAEISIALIRDALKKETNGNAALGDKTLQAILQAELNSGDHVDSQITAEFADLQSAIENNQIAQKLRAQVIAVIESTKPDYWDEFPLDPTLDDRQKFMDALEKYDDDNDNGLFLRHCIELLVRFEPDEDFYHYLWQALAFIEWQERPIRSEYYKQVLYPDFIKICEQIPQTNDNYFESLFLKGSYARSRSDYADEAAVYEDMVNNPQYPTTFDTSAYTRWAKALERLHEYEDALIKYQHFESDFIDSSKAVSALIRSIYINLELGHLDEALRIVTLLEEAPSDIRENADANLQISELLLLKNHPEGLIKFWKNQNNWQSEWELIFKKLDSDFEPNTEIPVFNDYTFTQDMFDAVKKEDKASFLADYHQLARAARWDSNSVNQLARLTLYGALNLYPEHVSELREMVVTLYKHYIAGDEENEVLGALYNAIALIDNDHDLDGILAIKQFQKRFPEMKSATSQSMLYLKILAERKSDSDLSDSTKQLEALLNSDIVTHARKRDIINLANIYRNAGKLDEEEALLKREIEHPQIQDNEANLKQLETRYTTLASNGQASEEFSKTTATWIETHKPVWFDYTEPKSIENIPAARLQQLVQNPSSRYTPIEEIKFNFLVARDSDMSSEEKWEAFSSAVQLLSYQKQDYAELLQNYSTIYTNDSYTEVQQLYYSWVSLGIAATILDKGKMEPLLDHPSYDPKNPEVKDGLHAYKAFIKYDWSSATELLASYKELAELEFTHAHLLIVKKIFSALLDMGETDMAQSILKDAANWNFSTRIGTTNTSVRLELFKQHKMHKKNKAMNAAMIQYLHEKYTLDGSRERPPLLDRVHQDELPGWLSTDDQLEISLYLVDQKLCYNWQPHRWLDLCGHISQSGKSNIDLVFSLFDLWFEHATDDMERSWLPVYAPGIVDTDDTPTRERLFALLSERNAPKEYPLTDDTFNFLKTKLKLRLGEDVELDSALDNLNHPYATNSRPEIKLKHYLIRKNYVALKSLIDSMEVSQLEAPETLPLVLDALSALGMEDELEILTDHAVKTRDRSMIASWATLSLQDAIRAIRLTSCLGDPETIPVEWYNYLYAEHRNPRGKASLEVLFHELNQNWEQLAIAAQKHINDYPTFYHFYWERAIALHKLGKNTEAIEPLRVYIDHSKDEIEYPKAVELLKILQPDLVATQN